jgi:hypothetical protein
MRPHPAQRLRAPTALPPSGPEIVPTGLEVGRWRLTERLTATTYGGVDLESGAPVVVKRLAPDACEREATALQTLRHPHLVRFAGRDDGIVVTERVSGPTLAELLADRGRLPWSTAARLLAPIADALAAVHGAGWVHGDVAPANIVLGDAGAVLVDLGRARPVAGAGASGTPGSVAPEVEAGAVVSTAADVWSLASVVVEAVTGGPPTPSTTLPPGVALALRRALATDPADRPSAAELAAALRAGADAGADLGLPNSSVRPPSSVGVILENGQEQTEARTTRDYGPRPPAPAATSAVPPRRRWPLIAAAGSVAAVALAVATRPDAAPEAAPPAPPVCALVGAGTIVGDPDGDGCPVAGRWADGVLTIQVEPGTEPRRYAVGAPGDVVGLGDWDCDGDDTPGLFRPTTGVVTLFDTWPVTADAADPSLVTTGDGLPDPGC